MDLHSELRVGALRLENRIVMATMTRSRAVDGSVPHPLAATYYTQRASAGLIITEATQVSPQGVGYVRTPGIHSAEQVSGWRAVVDAVHRAGGLIALQLWHVGRISHPDFHGGALPVAPSAISPGGEVLTEAGMKPRVTPRALELAELPGIVTQYQAGAENAKRAGFDGVELHGANGYLLDQFTRDGTNQRTDAYGGSIANRARLPLEVTRAVIDVWGPARKRALEERDLLQKAVQAEGGNFMLAAWDWRHYAEKVRKARYDVDEAEIKPYLQLDNVIAAAFDVATKLFGVTFKERKDLPVYHPDVRAFEVLDKAGKHVGLFFADYYARPSKRSGAWMSGWRDQYKLGADVTPIVVNVMNFAKGAPGEPSLLSLDDARTLFHEFGHGLHGLLSNVPVKNRTHAASSGQVS